MSTNGGDSVFPKPQPAQSGIKTVLQYTGIPPSWLDKRPKVPSRNWLIFLSVTSAITGYYLYDRKQCKTIRQEYVDKVQHLSKVPLHSMALPRKVTVYGCKWPADEDYDRSLKYFRKYVKPILNAAAIDHVMINGRRHGDLADRIANDIKKLRRIQAGIDPPPPNPMNLTTSTQEAKRQRELEGGIIIVGRPAFKEFMTGLKRGWTEGLEIVDKEEQLAQTLENDGQFDEPDSHPASDLDYSDDEPIPTQSKLAPSKPFSPFSPPLLRQKSSMPSPSSSGGTDSIPPSLNAPPSIIPPQPPVLLVSFLDYIGLTYIPHMIYDFFNERHKVRAGAEDAYRIIVGQTRPMTGRASELLAAHSDDDASGVEPIPADGCQSNTSIAPTDLDFNKDVESYYKKSYVTSFLTDIGKARENYYSELTKKLETARALARGTREPTKEEQNYPPPTEVELRAERMKKELRWRSEEKGWEIIRPKAATAWDPRFEGVLGVFAQPSLEREAQFQAEAQAIWEREKEKEKRREQEDSNHE
ncbi:inner membrane protein import complex subunit Tim54-domain-containing protein [Irpex rosettiformis]|uniref:Inner membrane protein import complex subunit Tim54-domain-containing protein n=1 Tax=Irpex rosettiformis TaxID=378272 RepID=A0ACB8UHG7_9APHY|nr:inner membrane protein import complex subunit Tim54-domain-containing protein [Irpex rosettiformis]